MPLLLSRRQALYFSAAPLLAQPSSDRIVVLTFDDAVATHATHVAPLLKEYGFPATFYVCEFPPDFDDKSKYMSWEQMAALSRQGFEVANHTRTHKHVDKMTRAEFTAELTYIEDKMAAHGIPRPVTFAYPAYATSKMSFEVLKEKGYQLARIGGSKPYEPGKDDPLLVPSYSTSGNDSKRVLDAIDQAAPGKIVVLTLHGVPDTVHPWVNTPPELFAKYLDHLKRGGFRVLAMRDLLPKSR